jgi:type IV pilus assembly protein PilP
MRNTRFGCGTLCVALLSGLAGCGDGGVQEIRQWMDDARKETKVAVLKLSPPKQFIPFSYAGKNSIDPFNPIKLSVALARLKTNSSGALKPDLERRRDPLESYPLDNLKMVGTLEKPGLSYALLQVDKGVFQVKVGNYIGQNFGMVTSITETEVSVKEIVQDASGDWVERKAKLELQETKK